MDGVGKPDIPLPSLNKNAVVYDLVYKPPDTNLLIEARELGYKASGGLSMLLYQGAESFEIWTGETAPVEVMKKSFG
jgi:shikimate dehydrogenase